MHHSYMIKNTAAVRKYWAKYVGKRLLVTDEITRRGHNELTLIEIAPTIACGKFRNELYDGREFWEDLENLHVLDVLKDKGGNKDT